jgi:serine/arginine repetitive matrix protein 1
MTSRALKTGAARAKTPAFPPEFKQKVDMTKVNVPLIQNWVTQEVVRILNNEDDIVIGMINTMLETKTVCTLQTCIATC